MLLYSTKPTLFPIILICMMCAPSKLSTCCISHTVSPSPTPSGNVPSHAHICTYKSNVLMTTPPQNLYILYRAGKYSFSSFFPIAIHRSATLTVCNTYSELQLLICFTQLLRNHKIWNCPPVLYKIISVVQKEHLTF